MTATSKDPSATRASGPGRIVLPDPNIPTWFHHRFLAGVSPELRDAPGMEIRTWQVENTAAASARVPGAAGLAPAAFGQRAREAYGMVLDRLGERGYGFPIRCWNLLPDILRRCGRGRDRYMVFNAARFQAFRSWSGQDPRDWDQLPTATGVGHSGEDLFISCMASREPGRNLENPRQCPSFQYSDRYGPLPPCFARATLPPVVAGGELLLVAGTASVRGERTVYPGDVRRQLDETLTNMASLVRAAVEGGADAPLGKQERERWLRRFLQLRVYVVRDEFREALGSGVREAFPCLEDLEWMRADLCRRDLLVEIEGVATTGGESSGDPAQR